ncbi:MAG: hypothetical protein WC314_08350 [Vulcanimicrobiota bacterium]
MEPANLAARLKALEVEDPLSPRNQSSEACARRLRLAAQLSDDGILMKKMKLRREYPDSSDEELTALLRSWLHDSAPPGYVEGFTVLNPNRFE